MRLAPLRRQPHSKCFAASPDGTQGRRHCQHTHRAARGDVGGGKGEPPPILCGYVATGSGMAGAWGRLSHAAAACCDETA